MRLTLAKKIGFLVALPVASTLLGVGFFASFLNETRHDIQFVNIAGRQCMLSTEIRAWAHMVALGQEENRKGLRDRVAEFDSAQTVLMRGGEIFRDTLGPAPREVQGELATVLELWRQLRPDLYTVAALPRSDPRFELAYRQVDTSIGALRDAANLVVSTFEAHANRLRRRMLALLAAIAAVTAVIFVVSLSFTRRFIVRPIAHLDEAARRIGGGDFSQRLVVTTRDELAMLVDTFNDMTGHVEQLLAALELRRKHAERIVASVPAGLLVVDGELRVLSANRSFLEGCHSELAAIVGRPVVEVLGIPELESHLSQALATDETRSGLLYTGQCPGTGDARPFRIAVTGTRLAEEEEEERLLVVVEDLTEEERLVANLAKLSTAVEQTADSVTITNSDGIIEYANAAFETLTGYAVAEAIGKTPRILKSGKHDQHFYETLWQTILAGKTFRGVLVNRRKNGELYTGEETITPLRNQRGEITHFVTVSKDITERAQTAEALRKSEATLRSVMENVVFGIYRSAADGSFIVVNHALVAMLGYESLEELLAVDLSTGVYWNPADRTRLIAEFGEADRFAAVEVDWKQKHGGVVRVRLSGRALRDARGAFDGFDVIVEDVRERQALEQQFRQAQKMEAVGQLAGGMAHDFNNLLTTILVSAELGAATQPPDSPLLADLDAIREAAQSGASLTHKLLAFSRRGRLGMQTLDLNKLLGDFMGLVRRLVPENIEMKIVLEPAGATVRGDPGAIEQIVMNLATNARDAMPDGGTLLIETTLATLDMELCRRQGWGDPGPYVALAVSDTGTGMDEETRSHIFEPFFTTKVFGRGSGLGMAMVYGMMKQHGGFVHVYSEPGKGTAVKVYFPQVSGVAERRSARPAAEARGGTETILLVEDESSLRRLGERVLAGHGYRVLLAADGLEALERMRGMPREVDLVITDMVMPRMSGPQLLQTLRSEGRAPRVLMTSGYSEWDTRLSGDFDAGVSYLAKPWTAQDLLAAVRAALDS